MRLDALPTKVLGREGVFISDRDAAIAAK